MSRAVDVVRKILGKKDFDLLCENAWIEDHIELDDEWFEGSRKESVTHAFTWEDSPEGHDYWEVRHDKVRNMYDKIYEGRLKKITLNGEATYV